MLDGACPGDVFAGPAGRVRVRDLEAAQFAEGHPPPRQQLHRRPHRVGDGQGDVRGRRHEDRHAPRQRRRRGEGLDLDRRPPRRGRQLLRHQGRGSRLGEWGRARRAGSDRREGHRQRAHHGHRAQLVHPAGAWHAAVRDRRRRDGDRHRHPRRARTATHQARVGQRDRRHPARCDRAGPSVRVGRRGGADGQRPGWHADQRALPPLRHRPRTSWPRRGSPSSAAT